MKKLILFAACALFTTASFAQDLLKEVKSCKNYKEALELISKGLDGVSDQDKAAIYNKVVDLAMKKIDDEKGTINSNQSFGTNEPVDSLGMYDATVEAAKAAILCDKYDNLPNEKGKVKPKFSKKNLQRVSGELPNVINAAIMAYQGRDLKRAFDCFSLYMSASQDKFFAENFKTPTAMNDYLLSAYYCSQVAYELKDYKAAIELTEIAMNKPEYVKDALQIQLFCMKNSLESKEDSVRYITKLKALHAKYPDNDGVFANLVQYYDNPSTQEELAKLISDEVKIKPNDPMAWAFKGGYEESHQKYDDAIASFKRALELKPDYIEVKFTLGQCLYAKAVDIQNTNSDRMGRLTPEKEAEVDGILKQALGHMVAVKEADPDRERVNWAYPMKQVYYALGDEAGIKEMDKYLGL